jgi:hypothetical protein
VIECLPSCLAAGARPKYAPIESGAHLHAQLAKTFVAARDPEAVVL